MVKADFPSKPDTADGLKALILNYKGPGELETSGWKTAFGDLGAQQTCGCQKKADAATGVTAGNRCRKCHVGWPSWKRRTNLNKNRYGYK